MEIQTQQCALPSNPEPAPLTVSLKFPSLALASTLALAVTQEIWLRHQQRASALQTLAFVRGLQQLYPCWRALGSNDVQLRSKACPPKLCMGLSLLLIDLFMSQPPSCLLPRGWLKLQPPFLNLLGDRGGVGWGLPSQDFPGPPSFGLLPSWIYLPILPQTFSLGQRNTNSCLPEAPLRRETIKWELTCDGWLSSVELVRFQALCGGGNG